MNYTTQMDAARKGIFTEEMQRVCEYENIRKEELMDLVAKGQVAIPANKNHKCLKPFGIGSKLKTKINVNLGTSKDCLDLDVEMEKVNAAISMGAEAIMDLSSYGDTKKFRRKLTAECPAVLGTVPIYDAVVYYNKALKAITTDEWIDIVRMHAEDGVDFVTLHCGITRKTIEQIRKHKRKMNIVSRGGSLVFAWICSFRIGGHGGHAPALGGTKIMMQKNGSLMPRLSFCYPKFYQISYTDFSTN